MEEEGEEVSEQVLVLIVHDEVKSLDRKSVV